MKCVKELVIGGLTEEIFSFWEATRVRRVFVDYYILSGVLLGVVTSFMLVHHGTCITVESHSEFC